MVGSRSSSVTSAWNSTGVSRPKCVNSTGLSAASRSAAPTCSTSQSAGTRNSTSFRKNWNACTYVAARIPPSARVTLTAVPAMTTPTQYGVPPTAVSTSPAVRNCGTT